MFYEVYDIVSLVLVTKQSKMVSVAEKSDYGQEITQSHTADQPTASRERATEQLQLQDLKTSERQFK